MDEFLPATLLIGLVFALVEFNKNITEKNWASVRTQASVWLAGVLAVGLAALSDFAPEFELAGRTFDQMNIATLVFVGLTFGGSATTLHQTLAKKSPTAIATGGTVTEVVDPSVGAPTAFGATAYIAEPVSIDADAAALLEQARTVTASAKTKASKPKSAKPKAKKATTKG